MLSTKKTLRIKFLEDRHKLTDDYRREKDSKICVQLCQFIDSYQIETICSYVSFRNEPDIFALMAELSGFKTIALPVIGAHGSMEYYPWQPNEPLQLNKYGIAEPTHKGKEPIVPNSHTLLLAPALAADKNCYRLGYGGGYMDRYLARYPKVQSVIVVYKEFVVEQLPREKHDVPSAYVATENNVIGD